MRIEKGMEIRSAGADIYAGEGKKTNLCSKAPKEPQVQQSHASSSFSYLPQGLLSKSLVLIQRAAASSVLIPREALPLSVARQLAAANGQHRSWR